MYQFMVITTRSGASFVSSSGNSSRDENATTGATIGGDIPTMSLTSGTNKWASRAVVALQLAAWSAVGIVLLEKGVANLQRNNSTNDYYRANNSSQHQVTSTRLGASIESIDRTGNVISVIPLVPIDVIDEPATRAPAIGYSGSSNDSATSDKPVNSVRNETTGVTNVTEYSRRINDKSPDTQRAPISQTTVRNLQREEKFATSGEEKNFITGGEKKVQNSRSNELPRRQSSAETSEKDASGTRYYNRTVMNEARLPVAGENGMEEKSEEKMRSRVGEITTKDQGNLEDSRETLSIGQKRLRKAQINGGGGGAAAAVAMVAVGAVMLVLGPAVIVLRALDERRQERRFLKLSGEEDLPPSYEQATGSIEQAPTYSSLNLDTISSPSSSSSSSNNSALLP